MRVVELGPSHADGELIGSARSAQSKQRQPLLLLLPKHSEIILPDDPSGHRHHFPFGIHFLLQAVILDWNGWW